MTFALLPCKQLMINARWFLPLLFTGLLLAGTGCASDESASTDSPAAAPSSQSTRLPTAETIQTPENPEPVPEVTLETMDGETIALAERPGEVLLVNFWATWCAPCRKEIPDLVKLQNELGPEGLTVIGISLDQQGEEVVTPFLDKYTGEEAINYPIVLDPEGEVEQAFGGVYGLPMTYVVGPDGLIQHQILGLFPVDEMRPKLATMLEGATSDAAG
jgi:thiol-disulfide isomerase/thioredoxin